MPKMMNDDDSETAASHVTPEKQPVAQQKKKKAKKTIPPPPSSSSDSDSSSSSDSDEAAAEEVEKAKTASTNDDDDKTITDDDDEQPAITMQKALDEAADTIMKEHEKDIQAMEDMQEKDETGRVKQVRTSLQYWHGQPGDWHPSTCLIMVFMSLMNSLTPPSMRPFRGNKGDKVRLGPYDVKWEWLLGSWSDPSRKQDFNVYPMENGKRKRGAGTVKLSCPILFDKCRRETIKNVSQILWRGVQGNFLPIHTPFV